jgi:putative FmdB family regulatory protein
MTEIKSVPEVNSVVSSSRTRFRSVSYRAAVCVEEATMPTYEYRCNKCGKAFERQEHVAEHEKSHPRCPKCQSSDVQPVLTDFYAKTSKKS